MKKCLLKKQTSMSVTSETRNGFIQSLDWAQESNNCDGLKVENGGNKSDTAAWFSVWVKLDASIAHVSWDLSVSLGDVIETLKGAVFFLLGSMLISTTFEWILNDFALSSLVQNVVHIAFIVGICTQAWDSHCISLKVLAVETFAILLSSNVSGLLS